MLTATQYRESNQFDPDGTQYDRGYSATLRYEVNRSSALKVQYDRFFDHSGSNLDYVGNSKTISVAYDIVF
jgi:hypothetical protein